MPETEGARIPAEGGSCPRPRSARPLPVVTTLACAALLAVAASCQTFPAGEKLGDLQQDGEAGFSPVELYAYINMGMSAWRESPTWLGSGWELDHFGHEETNTMGVAIVIDDVLHFAFRGSQAPRNRIDSRINFMARAVRIPFAPSARMRAHRGFLLKYLGVREEVHRRVREHPGLRIVLAGHSAGGAVASLACFDLLHAFPDRDIRAVTFGMPRVFNAVAARHLDSLAGDGGFVRIVHGRDMIPNVPPAAFGYRHVGRIVRMGERPWHVLYSEYDHWPGYLDELRTQLAAKGVDRTELGY